MVEFLTAEPILEFDLAGIGIAITQPMLVTTAIVLISMVVVYFLTRDLKVIPEKKKQVIMEAAYNFIYGLVSDNMGEKFMSFVPFIGSIIMFLILVNFIGLTGIQPPTTSFYNSGFGAYIICCRTGYCHQERRTWQLHQVILQALSVPVPDYSP